MSKATIIIDGADVTVEFGAATIGNVNSVAFGLFGERPEINLTTIDATKFKTKLLGDLQKVQDVVVSKKSEPALDAALYDTVPEALVITYKVGKKDAKVTTFYAQLKNISASSIERAPGDGVNVDLNFFVTNMDEAFDEIGPETVDVT
jgi:hypothetical protein